MQTILQCQGIHHITLNGADRKTSIGFWQGVLGTVRFQIIEKQTRFWQGVLGPLRFQIIKNERGFGKVF